MCSKSIEGVKFWACLNDYLCAIVFLKNKKGMVINEKEVSTLVVVVVNDVKVIL